MTQSHEQNPGIAAGSETQRSAELKESRNALVDRTNEFLEGLAAKRVDEVTQGGFLLQHSGVIVETDLGSNDNLRRVGVDIRPGISLTGDGREKPLELQAVLPSAWVEGNTGRKIITMRGTDPLSRQVQGEHSYEPSRRQEIISSFKVENDQGGTRDHSGYEVRGDGSFRHVFLPNEGVNTRQPVNDAEAAAKAHEELEAAITTIQRSLAS